MPRAPVSFELRKQWGYTAAIGTKITIARKRVM